MEINLLDVVDDSFYIYAGMTIEDRAIVDARDAIKPAARMCMYAQFIEKITYKKPFKKSHKSVAAAMDHFYVHGDAACYDLLVRMAQPFSLRYMLEDFDGQCGHATDGKASAARYTEMRLGELGCILFDGIEKHCINEWEDNYDNTEQYPTVVPSLGFYNICNGTTGIATGLASSIPQFNVREVNEAMIKLLWNRDTDFEDIYCAPDFCTGGTIINASRVKELMRDGYGGAIKLRSTAEYDPSENCLYFTELPYGVYAGTVMEQIKKHVESGELLGIEKILDLSTNKSKIKVVLEKATNPTKITKQLFKLTSLQDSYTINMTMLQDGRFPKVYTWKEALLAHIDHEISCKRNMYEYDINKMQNRIHIIDGLLIALADIDAVIELIKKASSKDDAKNKLCTKYNIDDEQASAILKMPLSRLIKLEAVELEDEKSELLKEIARIQNILDNKELLYKEIEDGMRAVIKKIGDERRTKLIDLDFTSEKEEEAEPIEKKELLIYYTNLGNIYTAESSTLMKTRRGGKGSKIKMAENEAVVKTINDDNFSSLLVFSNLGKMYTISIDELPVNAKVNVAQLFDFEAGEKPTTLTSLKRKNDVKYFVFVTKFGMIKKTAAEEYEHKRGKSVKAINLKGDDEVINVMFMNEEKVGILTFNGNFVIINTDDINAIGRATSGVKAIKLSDDDYVIDAKVIEDKDQYMITLSKQGLVKKAPMTDFPVCNRGIKGKKISDIRENDSIVKFLTLKEDSDIIIIVKQKNIKISTAELRELSRAATGVKAINIDAGDIASDLVRG
jgi:DNA gyrase subunit A